MNDLLILENHLLILINHLLILINVEHLLILINDFLILINDFLILINERHFLFAEGDFTCEIMNTPYTCLSSSTRYFYHYPSQLSLNVFATCLSTNITCSAIRIQ